MVNRSAAWGTLLLLPLVMGLGGHAQARAATHGGIACKDEFQTVEGNQIATPYCEDANLAKVAREHGSKVTAFAIRNIPGLKSEICRFVGSDNRAKDDCSDDNDDKRRGSTRNIVRLRDGIGNQCNGLGTVRSSLREYDLRE
jgi:hypothetical protein